MIESERAAVVSNKLNLSWKTAIPAAILITIASGWLHGQISRRWDSGAQLQSAARRLEHPPKRFGDWELSAEHTLGDSAMELLECRGYVYQTFLHRPTGRQIRLALLVGPGAKMSIHVPEICMEASNYTLIQRRKRFTIDEPAQAFWATTFRVNDASERKLQVVYGWYHKGRWQAPNYPRWTLAGAPVLYKLQLTIPQEVTESLDDTQFVETFLAEYLPRIESRLDHSADDEIH